MLAEGKQNINILAFGKQKYDSVHESLKMSKNLLTKDNLCAIIGFVHNLDINRSKRMDLV